MSEFEALCNATSANATDEVKALCALASSLNESNATMEELIFGVNSFFLIFGASLVFMMQTGFAMLCAGCIRQKNVKNIILKNLLDACGGAIGFFTVGYAFAFGATDDKTTFIGNTFFGLRDFDSYANWFFQFAFAATAATIVAGAVAERCKMAAYLCYSIFVTSFVYPVVVHAVWSSNGFLTAFRPDPFRGVGAIDFAGSGVVHLVGGVTSLHAITILGPRKGRFYDEDGNPLEKPATFVPHNASLQVLGAFLLWFGWYGFNPVSALIVTTENAAITAALAAVTSTIAAASGAVSAMFTETIIEAMQTGEVSYDVSMAVNGCLSGLVAVTAGCAVVSPGSACIIGIVSGWAYIGASKLLLKLRLDDAVDAVPVHLANGIWGLIAVGLFANEQDMARAGYNSAHQGWFYEWGSGSGDANLLLCQFCEILFIIGWVTVIMFPFFYVLNIAGMFRVDPLEEEVGLDISHHRGVAYDLANAKKEDVDELMEIRASRHGKVEVPVEVAQAADNAGHDHAASP